MKETTADTASAKADDSNEDVGLLPAAKMNTKIKYGGEVNVTTKSSRTTSIKLVMQRDAIDEDYSIREVMVRDGSQAPPDRKLGLQDAIKALNKSKLARRKHKLSSFAVRLDKNGSVFPAQDTFVNETEISDDTETEHSSEREKSANGETRRKSSEEDIINPLDPRIMFTLKSSDGGFHAEGSDITGLWRQVHDAVSHARANTGTNQKNKSSTTTITLGPTGEQMLGLTHSALQYLLEQFPGAAAHALKYRWKHHAKEPVAEVKVNPTGCARSEPFPGRSRQHNDMFKWLSSRHRRKPHPGVGVVIVPPEVAADPSMQAVSGRRATSLDLPMAMRYRRLAAMSREAVGVYASNIHGIGLFCKREISPGEMVIEYTGEEIRAGLTDYRERYYESKGIDCYMFRIDDDLVVDATKNGNAARFINHSCDPNCYSKIVDILGKKHIIIFSLRKILPGEELTYDYKFPIEDVKIKCYCGAKRCKKFMN
eukprot:TRINITY_DN11749_c0_g1_i2.p1 TRINITY_DN11749_c0_g1~~TRINITY_DN11749_c0_g1_i2.p1  ORF type:complete len:483 (-),score=95.74 TRINITY_DN11749_c0_g1_i2:284-1732(-)